MRQMTNGLAEGRLRTSLNGEEAGLKQQVLGSNESPDRQEQTEERMSKLPRGGGRHSHRRTKIRHMHIKTQ